MRREGLGDLQQLSDDVSAADWIVAAVRDDDHTVGSLVPPVFEAYARIFHPATCSDGLGDQARPGGQDVEIAWAQVATANGRQAHAGMQWVAITGSWKYHHGQSQPGVWDTEPAEGSLPAAQAEALVAMPQRQMRLLSGPLSQAARVSMEIAPLEQSPSLWWPADRAWCVATDVDLMSTYVGGSRACIEAVLATPGLEVWEVDDRQGVTYDSDVLNPVPTLPL